MNDCIAYDDSRDSHCWAKNGENVNQKCDNSPRKCPLAPRVLNINLFQLWFYRHLKDKPEDYREITPYWVMRLMECSDGSRISRQQSENIVSALRVGYVPSWVRFRKFDLCEARNGYSKNRPMWLKTHKGTTIGIGRPEWGAPSHPVFIIKLGEVLETKNLKK